MPNSASVCESVSKGMVMVNEVASALSSLRECPVTHSNDMQTTCSVVFQLMKTHGSKCPDLLYFIYVA